jgi:putative ATP-dependent endonuclease of OLD family
MGTLQLVDFEVTNYKPIRHASVSVNDLCILIGKNDAGKSSFLEAIKIFLDCDKPSEEQFHKDTEEMVFRASFDSAPDQLFEELNPDYHPSCDCFEIKREFTKRPGTTPKTNTTINGESISKGAIVINGDTLTGPQSRNHFWGEYLPVPIPILAERDVHEETKLKGGTTLNRLLLPILEEGGMPDSNLNRKVTELEDELQETASEVGEQLTENIQTHRDDIEEISISPGNFRIDKAIKPTVTLQDKHYPEDISIADRGSGIGSLLILSMMQAYVDMQVGDGYCLLFEEPENFLHPGAERRMLNALRSISKSGGQVFLTTHSQVFIDNKQQANMHLVKRKNGISNFNSVDDNAYRAVEEIGARNSDLLQSDLVIYTEGPSDGKIIEVIGEYSIDGWSEKNIAIQTLGGSNLYHCDPDDLKRINQNSAIILDSEKTTKDDSVKKERIELRENSTSLDIPCHILEYRAIENYFSDAAIKAEFDFDETRTYADPYCNVVKQINKQVAKEKIGEPDTCPDAYQKVKHGRNIAERMYENGGRIEEIEGFLRENIPN